MFHAASIWACLNQSNSSEAADHLRQIPEQLREHPFFTFLSENVYMAGGQWEELDTFAKKQIEWQADKTRF